MKKLFLFAALLMTGFAFYSCEDVVDNPAKDPAQSWNYSVSVKFADFDFSAQPTDPVTGEPNAYVAPTTLYVLNEQNTLMGTITTDAAPAAGNYATYAGTITGSIGNNLIITTKIGNDLGKQDGTLKSAIENGIVQTAEVPIKIYNANSGTLTTASAKMENTATIAHIASWQIKGGDKITFVADDQPFEWTVYEEFNTPATSQDLYIAIPTSADPEAEYTISTDSKDGYTRGLTLKLADYPSLIKGKVSGYLGYPQFIETGVDLTKYDAFMRTDPNNTWYMNNIKNGWGNTFNQKVEDGKTFTITQSGGVLDSLSILVFGTTGKEINVTLNNIRLGKNRQLQLGANDGHWYDDGTQWVCENGAATNLTLIGETKFTTLSISCPYTLKGTGSLDFSRLVLNSYGKRTADHGWNTYNYVKAGAATFNVEKDMDLEYIEVNDGATLNIADGKKLNVVNDNGQCFYINSAKLNIGKGAILNAESKSKNSTVIYAGYGSEIKVGESAELNVQGAKECTALSLYAYSYDDTKCTNIFAIGKKAKVNLIGRPEGKDGYGMSVQNSYNATTTISLDEEASLTAIGNDEYGVTCSGWSDDTYSGSTTITIAKNAKFIAEDTEAGMGISFRGSNNITIDGAGTFEAKCAGGVGMNINGSGTTANVFFKVGNTTITGGEDKPAIQSNKIFTIDPEIKSFKAIKGADATLYIAKGTDEALLEEIVADKTKFNEETADGARTITPKPAAE